MLDPTSSPHHENDNLDAEEEGFGGHPLFPRAETETGPDRRRFDWIQVVRYLPDGTREVCPKMYKGSELRSWQQIVDEHGGGCTYQLGGQTADGHRFTAWSAKAYFASPPLKSFGGGPWVPRQDSSNAAPVPQPQPQTTSNTDAMLQMNLALIKILLDRNNAPQPPPPNPIEMLKEAGALLNGANRGPNAIELIKDIAPLFNRGDNTNRAMLQGMEIAREAYKLNPPVAAAPARSNGDDLGDIMNIFKMISAVRPANPPAPAAAPAPAQAPQQQQNAFAPPCPPPPGYGWMYTQQGWVAFPIAMTTHSPVANRVAAPIPQPAPAPAPRAVDEDAWLRAMLGNAETRAKLQALLAATSPEAPPPVPPAAPPVPVHVAPSAPTPPTVQAPPGAPQTPASPSHALSDMLSASGWSFTPSGATAEAFHYTKPVPAPPVAVSPAEPPPANSYEIPSDVPMDDELRAMLADPGFREIATSVMPPDAQGAFTKLVQQNALRLQETAEA